ncbi:MAG: 3-carboxy-cis,cis-muconate cycloisomerase [Pseudonocardia sp. SCN 73-27]|uniref:lyase family protein n=1 Tax=Pseudonocardia sp. SCN 73-27 TaxID=1660132 RepID=UPI0008686BA4|nr:lyase family protein [Pseudonocardia sp. SCN 73-27]ODV01241.1 MAG: 3-carboxy-cis,cis-muconate cycloisomerase [Pseudonocardia sp. SCN 73-27]
MSDAPGGMLGPLLGADRVAATLDARAWLHALLDVEVALTHAAAGQGLVDDAWQVERAAEELRDALDPAVLAVEAVEGGNPVIPLVRRLRAAAGPAGAAVHPGATSQDVMDTALVLLVRAATAVIDDDLRGAADAAARLAATHRDTPMAARTLGQQALPTTFGLVAAGWCAGLDRARHGLAGVVGTLPVQFGGAAGTLAASRPHGPAVADALADRLALGVAAGACAKPATDVVLLAATEVGEVSESAPGASSSMPHKRNPVAAVTARASARRAPGLVATLLASADHEHQRAAGPWHAEWPALTDLLCATGGAAARLRTCLEGLQVHPEAMARNLSLTDAGGTPNHAGDLVDRILRGRER